MSLVGVGSMYGPSGIGSLSNPSVMNLQSAGRVSIEAVKRDALVFLSVTVQIFPEPD
jgi:hypothetical protein